jgi:cobalamin biosynthesis protein CbiD
MHVQERLAAAAAAAAAAAQVSRGAMAEQVVVCLGSGCRLARYSRPEHASRFNMVTTARSIQQLLLHIQMI